MVHWSNNLGPATWCKRCAYRGNGPFVPANAVSQDQGIEIWPFPTRAAKVRTLIKSILQKGVLAPEICWQGDFLSTAMFGQVGRALLRELPIYTLTTMTNMGYPMR